MRVGLSLLTLVPGRMGGSETYVRGLVRGLATTREVEAHAFVPAIAPGVGDGLPTTVVGEYRAGRSALARARALALAAARPGPPARRYAGMDVVHYPLTVPVPRVRVPTVVTLHDVQHRDLPEHSSRTTRLYRALAYDRAARRADAVVVVSEFVRERAVATLGLDPARVHVAHEGVDHAVFVPGPPAEREAFLLYPARAWPHKNHRRLFEAFALLRRERPDLRLVLTGGDGGRLEPLPAGVEHRGAVSLEELAALYRRAACLVFPSLYEGFGLPPLEALASGCPVAAARAGAVPEVCGDAAVLFDPYDPAAIAAGVREALARADELRDLGLRRAARFTWEACARGHAAVYRSLG
ncbi:MAG TPA: glycosyltransferase family 1 protein [Gaiellaceae bacterium]|nr:glycosyltransferase family 1 protein [Gaiellaceae bacterium]